MKSNAGVLCQTDGGKKDKYLLHYNRTNINKAKAVIQIVDLFIRTELYRKAILIL